MFRSSVETLEQFKEVLLQLSEDCYRRSCDTLAGASIGQHTRHVIELYQCLLRDYEEGEICYDKRARDRRIEEELLFATDQISRIQKELERPDKDLHVVYDLHGRDVKLSSNYEREVMYNLEHTIHHEALIKVAIKQFTDIELPESFGVAPSTMAHRHMAVQNG